LKKRSKKLLIISASVFPDGLGLDLQKFFGSFFQKRTACLSLTYAAVHTSLRVWFILCIVPDAHGRVLNERGVAKKRDHAPHDPQGWHGPDRNGSGRAGRLCRAGG
jgi:hypothetical protein